MTMHVPSRHLTLPPPLVHPAVKTAYVGGRMVYYIGQSGGEVQQQPQSLGDAARRRKAVADNNEENMLNKRGSPTLVASSVGSGVSSQSERQARGTPVQYTEAVPVEDVRAQSSADAPFVPPSAYSRQQAVGISANEEAMLTKINRLRAHTQHELNRVLHLSQKEQLAEGGADTTWVPSVGLEIVGFAAVSLAATLLVCIRIGMPLVAA